MEQEVTSVDQNSSTVLGSSDSSTVGPNLTQNRDMCLYFSVQVEMG